MLKRILSYSIKKEKKKHFRPSLDICNQNVCAKRRAALSAACDWTGKRDIIEQLGWQAGDGEGRAPESCLVRQGKGCRAWLAVVGKDVEGLHSFCFSHNSCKKTKQKPHTHTPNTFRILVCHCFVGWAVAYMLFYLSEQGNIFHLGDPERDPLSLPFQNFGLFSDSELLDTASQA